MTLNHKLNNQIFLYQVYEFEKDKNKWSSI